MSSWNAPAELTSERPRRGRIKPRQKRLLFFLNGLFLAPVILVGAAILDEIHNFQILKERGADTTAVVINLHINKGRGGNKYIVDYEYVPENAAGSSNDIAGGVAVVGKTKYSQLRIGDEVPITYDPQDSKLSRPNFANSIHQHDPISSGLGANKPVTIVIGAWLIMTIGMTAYFLRSCLREKRLLEWGEATSAKILSEEEYKVKNQRVSRVRYSFIDSHGKIVEGTHKYVPTADAASARDTEFRAQIMRNPTVLFDPRDSSKNVLYPPLWAELV